MELVRHIVETVPAWVWAALSASSLVLALASVVVMPRLVVRLPADWLLRPDTRLRERLAEAPRPALVLLRNGVGAALVALGVLMLFVPGQGVLTVLAGLALVDLPGKRPLARWLLARRQVARAVQALRRRAGVPPLLGLPGTPGEGGGAAGG